jgi:signal peptide peptidase SppA
MEHESLNPPVKKTSWKPFIIAMSACAVLAAALFILNMTGSSFHGDYIGQLYITGEISQSSSGGYDHSFLLDKIESMENDPSNQGILLYVDSPGGTVYESDEMYNALLRYKENTGCPVYAYMANTAASGALYISMAADRIAANRMTTTGSIGVIMSSSDFTGLYDKLGIKTYQITSGKHKAMLSGNNDEQTLEEDISILQRMVDEYYGYFVNVISTSRDIPNEQVRQFADGRTFTATQARDLGLIDEVLGYDDAVNDFYQKNNIPPSTQVRDFVAPSPSLWDSFFSKVPSSKKESSSSLPELLMQQLEAPEALFLPEETQP